MRSNNKLTILHDDNGSFIDHSLNAFDFKRDSFLLELKTTSFLYVGFYKPINVFFAEMKSANNVLADFVGEYYNGKTETWEPLTGLFDDTRGFMRSGFISFDRNQLEQSEVEINGETLFWIRLKPSANHSATTAIQGINIVYSDDNDLLTEFPVITSERYLSTGSISHIMWHVAALNEIIQRLRNGGHLKTKATDGYVYTHSKNIFGYLPENITPWDILDMGELRQASTYLTLSKIFQQLSDADDDYFEQKGKYYYGMFKSMFKTVTLSIDKNDDGFVANNEKVATNATYMTR